jgi:hypothetical protein
VYVVSCCGILTLSILIETKTKKKTDKKMNVKKQNREDDYDEEKDI